MNQPAVLYEYGYLDTACKLTPQQVLLRHGSGVYTTALITPDLMIIDWELHKNRVFRGIELLNSQPSRPFQPLIDSLQAQGSSLDAFWRHHVLPPLRATLTAAFHLHDSPDPNPSKASEGQEGSEGEPAGGCVQTRSEELRLGPGLVSHTMLVICIDATPPPPPPVAVAALAAQSIPPQPTVVELAAPLDSVQCESHGATFMGKEPRDQDDGLAGSCLGRTSPSGAPKAVVKAARDEGSAGPSNSGAKESENDSGDDHRPHASVTVYCKAVQPPSYGLEYAVQAAVMGHPRPLPGAKATSWVAERRKYEAAKPPDAAEVLLSDTQGRILEGLVSNFCVITYSSGCDFHQHDNDDYGEEHSRSGHAAAKVVAAVANATSDDTTAAATATAAQVIDGGASDGGATAVLPWGATLHICGPEAGTTLPGVFQTRVLQAAAVLGLKLDLQPPGTDGRGVWQEAFLCNCIKSIQPLSRVFCPPENPWGWVPWQAMLPYPAGPVTSALLREVGRLQQLTHVGGVY